MKFLEITHHKSEDAARKDKVLPLVEESKTLAELITTWLKDESCSISFWQAADDQNSKADPFGISLRVHGISVADLYYDKEDLRKEYPGIPPVSSYIRGVNKHSGYELNEEALELYERSIGFDYSDALGGILGTKLSLLPFILPYILSEGGSITIEQANDSWLSEEDHSYSLEEEGLTLENLWLITASYQSPAAYQGTYPGWGSDAYIRIDDL